jgi:DNA-binding HxlR family transcriptional regulator
MLTTTLRILEPDGFCTREVFPTVPPRVEYELTALGRDLLVPVKALGDWAIANRVRVDAARRRFDARNSVSGGAPSGRPRLAP